MRRYVEWIIRRRALVIGLTVLFSGVLVAQIKNLHVVIDPDRIFPQTHPYMEATNKVEEVFGSKYVITIGITPREGDAFQPTVLAKVQRITAALLETPGVVRANLLSFAARRAKNIVGTGEGMEARPLMETVPQTPQAIAALRQAIHTNPAYVNIIATAACGSVENHRRSPHRDGVGAQSFSEPCVWRGVNGPADHGEELRRHKIDWVYL